uniref:Uncharacterized protein n=1 Tax=Cacopsylla melanoneura TaxID=428564 RepID=A0A8D8Q780_9HEMI
MYHNCHREGTCEKYERRKWTFHNNCDKYVRKSMSLKAGEGCNRKNPVKKKKKIIVALTPCIILSIPTPNYSQIKTAKQGYFIRQIQKISKKIELEPIHTCRKNHPTFNHTTHSNRHASWRLNG